MVLRFSRIWFIIIALLGASGVALGAVAAHAVNNPIAITSLERATTYHLMHTIALLALSGLTLRWIGLVRILMLIGLIVFSGAIYAKYLMGIPSLGQYAPMGGTMLILSWLVLGISALLHRTN
ncbi:DUF423 domain-containing protein [Orrella sp. 11846]|uniref:DUF423 domain-containing protein n=1 Tax=Orrella sp. 11846 TaxID=3409913 RepID=UPI003B598C88